jgi:hypothetical protein
MENENDDIWTLMMATVNDYNHSADEDVNITDINVVPKYLS